MSLCLSPLTAGSSLASPDKGCRVLIPSSCCGFQPLNELCWIGGRLTCERAADEDALNGLGHVQPTACNRRIERHDALCHQPVHQFRGLVSTQIVQHEQHPQGGQLLLQRPFHTQSFLPTLPNGSVLCRWHYLCLWQTRQDVGQGLLHPGMQHSIRAARDALNADCSAGGVEEGQQLSSARSNVFVRLTSRFALRLPTGSQVGNGLIGASFVFRPHRYSTLFSFEVGTFNQLFFASALGSVTFTTPLLRCRCATPVSHHVRSRCHVRPASRNTPKIVYVLSCSKPGSRRRTRCSVESDQVAVPSCSRSGGRRAVSRIRFRSAEP